MAKERLKVEEKTQIASYTLDGLPLRSVIATLTELDERHEDATFSIDIEHIYGDEYIWINLVYNRPETDKEMEERLERSERARAAGLASGRYRKEKKEKEERKLYEKLKKKFEKGAK